MSNKAQPDSVDVGRARLREAIAAATQSMSDASVAIDANAVVAQRRILDAFRQARIGEGDLGTGSGYGYGDRGRDAVERVFARVMGTEAALVRSQIVSGTHAIAIALFGVLQAGDTLLAATGTPYDTLLPVIGPGPQSLAETGIAFASVDPWAGGCDGEMDLRCLAAALAEHHPRVVLIQRSRGYSLRPALSATAMAALVAAVRREVPEAVIMVDNCYAEFVGVDPAAGLGVDLLCGSLIKNPGGGIAPTGGYVAGRRDLIERAAARLYAPGLGSAVGPGLVPARLLLEGLFLAPGAVAAALKGAVYAAALFAHLGFVVDPLPAAPRADIIQAIALERRDLIEAFCRAIQANSPVDSHVMPEFAPMAGYGHDVIMAAGTFVQGASLELSADAPDRPPYWVFLQGGLGVGYVQQAVEAAASAVLAHLSTT
jgi:cystathionine beta-lyase family protein involved in aluminum resistance